jgi:hypothetical protein
MAISIRLAVGASLALALTACQTRGPDKTQVGQLGNATFTYLCDSRSADDAYCDVTQDATAFPTLALGADFYVKATASATLLSLSSVSTARISEPVTATGPWSALAPGITSLVTPGDREPKPDYIDVSVLAPITLELSQITQGVDGKVTGTVGKLSGDVTIALTETFLRAAPLDAKGEPLGGTLKTHYLWTTSDPTIVTISSDANKHIIKITAGGSKGTAKLTVTNGSLAATANLVVK